MSLVFVLGRRFGQREVAIRVDRAAVAQISEDHVLPHHVPITLGLQVAPLHQLHSPTALYLWHMRCNDQLALLVDGQLRLDAQDALALFLLAEGVRLRLVVEARALAETERTRPT